MTATTKANLDGIFFTAMDAAADAGVDTTGWGLVHGSKNQGNAYVLQRADHTVLERLGSTRNEAYAYLTAMTRAFRMVTEAHVSGTHVAVARRPLHLPLKLH
jgi:hypothetical protein